MNFQLAFLKTSILFVLALAPAFVSANGHDGIPNPPRLIVSLAGEQKLATFEVNDAGKLIAVGETSIKGKPGTSRFNKAGDCFYVATSDPGQICAFSYDENGLKQLNAVETPGKASFLGITPSGKFLVASYYKTGKATVHRISKDGRLSAKPTHLLDIAPRAHGLAIDRSGKYVFVTHTKASRIAQFRLDPETGKLLPNDPPVLQREIGVSPRHLDFHPTENFVFGSNESGRSISVYQFEPEKGTLGEIQTLPSMPKDVPEKSSTSHMEVHPSGRFVYIANRGHASIAVFSIDQKSGKMTFVQHVDCEPVNRSFNLSPDGKYLVAAGQKSSKLIAYRINKTDGKLTRTDTVSSGNTPWWVSFVPRLKNSSTSTR